jgi:teichuronic acid biosynthesis glycosyltransferase TuaC
MKILVISHMYPSIVNELAGIFVHQQVKELVNQGCEVKVVSPVPWSPFPINCLSENWKLYARVPNNDKKDGIEIHYPKFFILPKHLSFSTSGFWMYLGLRQLLKKIHQEFPFELIHAHVALPDGYAAMLARGYYRVPLVVTIHGQDLSYTIQRSKICKEKVWKVLSNADKIITVSKKLKSLLEDRFCKKVEVVNNGVELSTILMSQNDYKVSNDSGERICISISDLVPNKGIEFNLQAISRLLQEKINLIYWIIGDGPEKKRLEKQAKDFDLNGKIKFFGRLPHAQTMRILAQADFLSLPSWNEGFGIAYIEAMALGKPVIALEDEGISDIVERGQAGLLVKPRDVDSLTAAMKYLLSHPEEAREMAERGQKLVQENLTWQNNCEKTISIYKQLLKDKLGL